MKQNVLNALLGGALLLSAPLFTSCEDILGTWERPSGGSSSGGSSAGGGIEYVAYTVSGGTATAATQTATTYTEVTSSTTTWAAGTYVVSSDVTIDGDVTISGDVELILCDGKTLTVNGHIQDDDISHNTYSLTIYGQNESSGILYANTSAVDDMPIFTKDVNIHGGDIRTNATNATFASSLEAGTSVNIYGGTVTATATAGTAIMTPTITVFNATVNATSANAYGIQTTGDIKIYSGTITAQGAGTYGAGINAGSGGTGKKTIIYGGSIKAINTDAANCIAGTVQNGSDATITYQTSTDGAEWGTAQNLAAAATVDGITAKYVRFPAE